MSLIVLDKNTRKPLEVLCMNVKCVVTRLFTSTTIELHIGLQQSYSGGGNVEAELSLPLPDGSAIIGFKCDILGVMVDGVVIPKELAQVAL